MKIFKILFILLLLLNLIGCEKNEPKKRTEKSTSSKEITGKPKYVTSSNLANDSADNLNLSHENQTKAGHSKTNYNGNLKAQNNTNTDDKSNKKTVNTSASTLSNDAFYLPLKKLLTTSEIGKPISKKELLEKYHFRKDGVDLMKTITRISKNKLNIEWGSTWAAESVSDAEFEDGVMEIVIKNDKLWVSGNAIGIKYNKKIYTNLILKDGVARIPSVKGYCWEIAK